MDKLEVAIAGAWHGAAFARTDRLPDLDKVLGKKKGARLPVDSAFTQAETRRWTKVLSEQAPEAAK